MSQKYPVMFLAFLLFVAGLSAVMADGRINVVHHFGGDVLYCTHEEGCKLLNIHGEELWHQPQSVIDAAMATACGSGETQTIDAGVGTYGPNALLVSCFGGDPESAFLNMTGYDEWGKSNIIQFGPDYLPVNPPVNGVDSSGSGLTPTCARFVSESEDGIHGEGYDIYHTVNGLDLDSEATFLFWSATDLRLSECTLL
jgi:hypothetical protein